MTLAGLAPRQGELVVFTPIAGTLPLACLAYRPPFTHPEVGALVAAVGLEGGEFGVRHQLIGDGEGFQPDPVARRFVIKMEFIQMQALSPVADRHQASWVLQPTWAVPGH